MFANLDQQMGVAPEPEIFPIWDAPLDLPSLLDTEPEEINWFIKQRLIAGRGAVVSGVGGSSKTTLIKQLAVGAVLGRLPWDWEINTPGRALLCLTEDTPAEAHRAFHNACLALELTYAEKKKVYENVIIYPLAGEDVILLRKNSKNSLENSPLFDALVKKIQSIGNCVFVGLDPALSLTDGDELDQGHQRRLGKMCDNLAVLTGSTVMLVAHAPKSQKEEITSHNSRGGGALVDAVRTEFVMRTMTSKEAVKAKISDPEERFRHVQLVSVKGNFLPPAAYNPVWLRRDNFGMLHGAELDFNPASSDCIGKKEKDALNVLIEICQDGTKPKLNKWMLACVEAGIIKKTKTQKAQQQEMHEIRKRLFDAEMIKKEGHGVWIPEDSGDEYDFDFND
ncbi:MAG: AAA family ATPase [Candidatus Omnitrophica bacterium]|nr:AAA family ATPase [Candidatus Omnitrophota bacterium]